LVIDCDCQNDAKQTKMHFWEMMGQLGMRTAWVMLEPPHPSHKKPEVREG
jgi:hypothetical protein